MKTLPTMSYRPNLDMIETSVYMNISNVFILDEKYECVYDIREVIYETCRHF